MKLYEFFDREDKWTKAALAKDKNGKMVEPDDPNAVSWCVIGGMMHLGQYFQYGPDTPCKKLKCHLGLKISSHSFETGLVEWNNNPNLTYEEFHKALVAADV